MQINTNKVRGESATGAVTKTETFVAASGNITLTLPVVTAGDNGLAITIKNVGTYDVNIYVNAQ